MVGVREIVIDGFRNADDAHFIAASDGLFVNFMGCVLGIVATGVKEIANIMRGEDLKNSIHLQQCSFRLFLEIDFVTAGAESGRGSMLEALDRLGFFLV